MSRGSVYDDGEPFGLYVAGMHGCAGDRFVVLAIAVNGAEGERPSAVSLRAWSTETEVQLTVLDPSDSPWREHAYLGDMLTREQALASPLIDTFYHVADHVLRDNPDVQGYLEGSEPSNEERVSTNEEPADAPPIHCSFCGKSVREVRKIIAGPAVTKFAAPGLGCDACRQRYLAEGRTEFPNVYICDECIGLCNDIIEAEAVAEEREEAGGEGGGGRSGGGSGVDEDDEEA